MEQNDCIFIESDDEERYKQKEDGAEDLEEILDFVDSKNWYSILIEDPLRHSTEDILSGLLLSIAPVEFVPVLVENSESGLKKIYATQCEKAIKKITSLGFQFYSLNDPINSIRVKVVHNDPPSKKVNPIKIIHDIIPLRFTKSINKLDLSNFSNDLMLRGKIYFPLWYSGNQKLIAILIKALSLTPSIGELDLSDNSISNFVHFNIPNVFSNVHTLDLSKNNLKSFQTLRSLQGHTYKITTLNLDGNDLCLSFNGEQNYIMCVKMIFPSLTKLDGRVLSVNGVPSAKQNFTVDWDAVPLIDKFMEIYFTLFDSDQRERLLNMYASNAVLSASGKLSCTDFLPAKKNRNLIGEHHSRATLKVFGNAHSIARCLSSFPKTLHDPFSFHVDIISHSKSYTMVHINGILKVPASTVNQDEPIIQFARTFVLSNAGRPPTFYMINNDMINFISVTSPSKEAFKLIPVSCSEISLKNTEKYLTDSVMKGIIDIFIHYTELPYTEAKSCLERNNWNLRVALSDVISMIETNKLPE